MIAVLILACCCLVQAKPALDKPVVPYAGFAKALEVEPNDDCSTAGVLVNGDDMSAAIDPSNDVDYYEYVADAGQTVTFQTHAGTVNDTKMWIYEADCTTQLAYNDDGGGSFYSLINYTFTAGGTYYVKVSGYSSANVGEYILTAYTPPPPPANDVCEGATCLPLGEFSIDGATTGYVNDYNPETSPCTGWRATGGDLVYKLALAPGGTFSVLMNANYDDSIYLVTDCADVIGSCVAGSDLYPSGSNFSYTNPNTYAEMYYLM